MTTGVYMILKVMLFQLFLSIIRNVYAITSTYLEKNKTKATARERHDASL